MDAGLDASGAVRRKVPVGETQNRPFQLSFNSSLRVDFQGARVTSDGGLIVMRELDERLRLSELVERHLSDSRRGKNIQLPLLDLVRQSVYSRRDSDRVTGFSIGRSGSAGRKAVVCLEKSSSDGRSRTPTRPKNDGTVSFRPPAAAKTAK